MKIDRTLPTDITTTTAAARALEARGYGALWATETKHEPFLQLLEASRATEGVTLGTAIAVAFARSPMTLATASYDMAQYTAGRFVLGLGSQVKPHIERRFSMPWSHPAARMRELVLAMRAIWSTWQDGTPLDFRGDFYTHTLMTPFFSPEPHPYGPPPVFLAAVGDRMTEVAGEVCDGMLLHPLTTPRYLEEVTVPALARGREAGGHAGLEGYTLAAMPFVAVGRDDGEVAAAVQDTKRQIAFYASTPAYRGVLDLHGWGDLQPELTRLSKSGRWDDMGELIDDDVLHAFAVVGSPHDVGTGLAARWGHLIDRATLYLPQLVAEETVDEIMDATR